MYLYPFPLLIRERGYAPVGDQGVEPCATALSERPLHRLSRRQRKTEVSSLAILRPPRVFRTRCRAGGASSRGERRSRPAAVTRPPVFGTGPAARQVHSPCRISRPMRASGDGGGRSSRNSPRRASRFPSGDRTLAASSSVEEGGRFERHGVTRASLSGRARHPDRFTFRTEPRTRTANLPALNGTPLPLG
jgi:hypothetical protein